MRATYLGCRLLWYPYKSQSDEYVFPHRKLQRTHVIFEQFPLTLAYVITDCMSQGQTGNRRIIADLRESTGHGKTTSVSPYVQLSRATDLQR
jgi:hypothetical protein